MQKALTASIGALLGATLFLSAAPAYAETGTAPPEGGADTKSATSCIFWLEAKGYDVGYRKSAACAGAEAIGGLSGITACTAALRIAGVKAKHAGQACTLGAAPEA